MKTRPILFSAPMVRAILSGTKTQTRRAVKITHRTPGLAACLEPPRGLLVRTNVAAELCPYGQPGDRLWVRETWAYCVHALAAARDEDGPFVYAADGTKQYRLCDRWRPSIHMPKAASRILLEITAVRVERLQDISDVDATAEGVFELPLQAAEPGRWWTGDVAAGAALHGRTPFGAYRLLWESINNPRSWDANPWVWVIEFTRVEDSKS